MTLHASRDHAVTAEQSGCDRLLVIVIVTYESADVLPGLLDSLRPGLGGIARHRVIVVDNNSSDDLSLIAATHAIRPEVIQMGRNAGYAAAINAAAANAGTDADLLVLNPDIRLFPGAALAMRARLADPSVGVVVPQILDEGGNVVLSLRREPSILTAWSEALLGGRIATRLGLGEIIDAAPLYTQGSQVEWATGAALMISAEARRLAGVWDESFFLYSEEVDYLRRIRQCGLAIEYATQARVVHIGGDYLENPFLSGLMAGNRIRDYSRRHGRAATGLFRLGVIAGELIRAGAGPGHRAALRAALTTRD
jgi:GT2 family glycosyltransferase